MSPVTSQLAAAVEELLDTYDLARTRLFASDTDVHRILGLKSEESEDLVPVGLDFG